MKILFLGCLVTLSINIQAQVEAWKLIEAGKYRQAIKLANKNVDGPDHKEKSALLPRQDK